MTRSSSAAADPLGPFALALCCRRRAGPGGHGAAPELEKIPAESLRKDLRGIDGQYVRGRRRDGRGRRSAGPRRAARQAARALADALAGPVHHRPDRPGAARRHRSGAWAATARSARSSTSSCAAGRTTRSSPARRASARRPWSRLRPADRRRRRAAAAEKRHAADARPGPAPGRGGHQGGVREPAQVGDRRGQGLAAADHPLHRRGPHADRRRRAGRPGRRGQPAQAGPGPRRAAHHRRHHLGRIQEVLREGRRLDPAVPGGQGRGADGGRCHGDDARAGRHPGEAPQGPHPRRGGRRRRAALASLPLRTAAARQGGEPVRHGLRPGGDEP